MRPTICYILGLNAYVSTDIVHKWNELQLSQWHLAKDKIANDNLLMVGEQVFWNIYWKTSAVIFVHVTITI